MLVFEVGLRVVAGLDPDLRSDITRLDILSSWYPSAFISFLQHLYPFYIIYLHHPVMAVMPAHARFSHNLVADSCSSQPLTLRHTCTYIGECYLQHRRSSFNTASAAQQSCVSRNHVRSALPSGRAVCEFSRLATQNFLQGGNSLQEFARFLEYQFAP